MDAGLPLQTPTVVARKGAAFPPVVGDGQRLATTHSAREAGAYPPHLTKLDLIVNMPFGDWEQ